jgi:uncharacterized membrane protein SpoIIM required for sporulation/uncharacterized RDD family membrane protein YckC
MAAGILDLILLVFLLLLISLVLIAVDALVAWFGSWAGASLIFLWFVAFWGYFTLFEALSGGRTPGKRRLGIRVVMDTGHPLTFQAALVRNLVRLVDLQPVGTYGVGALFVFFNRQHKRLGDAVAGTIVVRDRPQDLALSAIVPDVPEQLDAGPPILSDEEFRLLDQLVARLSDLEPAARARFTAGLAQRFANRLAPDDWLTQDDLEARRRRSASRSEQLLVRLHDDELTRRRARAATRRSGRGHNTAGTAQRFVANRQSAWEGFRNRALQLERDGINALSGEDLIAFAAEYRTVAADLARARTYMVDLRVIAYLERIVGAGHNALYGLRGVRRFSIGRLLLQQLPAATYRARFHVLLACLLFLVPGIVGYVLVRERPQIVHQILPDGMIARAESGEYLRESGRGYAQTPSPYLPLVASSIITNNIQVAFGAFAFGVTAGVGTVGLLAFNGLFFGAVLAMFANYGLASWILTFVAGHGVLELTAIFIAGAGGLLIGRAIIAPGDLTRRDALVINGRLAVQLVGASGCLLLIAGLVEGFLSASGAPTALKIGVSAASLVLVGLYFAAGYRAVRAAELEDAI